MKRDLIAFLILCPSILFGQTGDDVFIEKYGNEEFVERNNFNWDGYPYYEFMVFHYFNNDVGSLIMIEDRDTILKHFPTFAYVDCYKIDDDTIRDFRCYVNRNEYISLLYNPEEKNFIIFQDDLECVTSLPNTWYKIAYYGKPGSFNDWSAHLVRYVENRAFIHGIIEASFGEADYLKVAPWIKIYKILPNGEKSLVEALRFLDHIANYDQKLEFVQRYWGENFHKFDWD